MAKEYYEGLFDTYEYVEMFSGFAINRGDLIAVNGKTIRELMLEEYRASGEKENEFDQWYREHLEEETKKHVLNAYYNDGYAEMFTVDEAGKVTHTTDRIRFNNKCY